MARNEENRLHERYQVSAHLSCKVLLRAQQHHLVKLSDISEGGMMVLLAEAEDLAAFAAQQSVHGEILYEDLTLVSSFAGLVVWRRDFTESGKAFATMGIKFAQPLQLPEAFREMLEADSEQD